VRHYSCPVVLFLLAAPALAGSPAPETVAEKTDFKATSRHADVVAFCESLARLSPVVKLETFGTSHEGRKLPLLVLADPPISGPADAARTGRTTVLVFGNIHAGEVDGKEALLMLARDLATGKDRSLLKHLVVLVVPILNADGNDRMGKDNRPGQNGPPETGTRANAQGLDLNRDFVKLESPEVRALVRLINLWDPALVIDTHTTNGSFHRYTLTYDAPRHAAADSRLVSFSRDVMLPEMSRRLARENLNTFFYGNFSRDRKAWETYPALPRYGMQYLGLRNRIGILSESYSYAPFKERVRASRVFVRACLDYVAENRDKVAALLKSAREATTAGRPAEVALRYRATAFKEPVKVAGFVEEVKAGKRVPTDRPRDYTLDFFGRSEPTLSVPRPFAYLYPASFRAVTENLLRHGIEVEELREDIELDVEVYRVTGVSRGVGAYQGHRLAKVEASAKKGSRRVSAGTILVRTGQALGTLAVYLLEPQAEDGLCAWNFFDRALKEGQEFPILRLPAAVPLTAGKVKSLREGTPKKKPITLEALEAGKLPRFSGNPVSGLVWLEDGEHFLQMKEGKLLKVHALTGRTQTFLDPEKFARTLAKVPGMGRRTARRRARSPYWRMNPQRTAALVDQGGNLFLVPFDGSDPVRLTKSADSATEASFSPDGRWVAFVRGNNLHVVNSAGKEERALTKDGSDTIFNGRADWVYYEEIFNRSRRAYWWSPDSTALVFLRFDDTPVKKFTVLDTLPVAQRSEATPYPKAGAPNPRVKVGIVPLGGGPVQWAALKKYPEDSTLIIRAGWLPDSDRVYFYAQDRTQTWLDFCTVGREGGEPATLFRDRTKAWTEDPGQPFFLKDGSFLLPSARTGWKHIYHLGKDGKLKRAITSGSWEIGQIHRVNEEGGWVYFSGTRDSSSNLYRVKLDGTELTRLTPGTGEHSVSVSPKANLFIDSWNDHQTPTRVSLARADGTTARTLDTNPVHIREEYDFLPWEMVRIRAPDGFELEGMVLCPKREPGKRYPVWLKVYGGPQMPTVRDTWYGGRLEDQALARAGYVIFRCDPRSASARGAVSAWTAWKQLGVQELKDLETAVQWLCKRDYIDPARVGISGHSYGGFMTAYALTHSKKFAAGVAGAPVTDWRNYDTIYTERYMSTPKENPKGYDRSSVVKAAKNLHGRLLLLHGMLDDNVHFQNTVQLADALQRADRDFEMMLYPRARHGLFGKHPRRLILDFMRRALGPDKN
jgi:dipeptidyl-peptidase 4